MSMSKLREFGNPSGEVGSHHGSTAPSLADGQPRACVMKGSHMRVPHIRCALVVLGIVAIVAVPCARAQASPDTRMVNVAGRAMRVRTQGLTERQTGRAVVILEAGAGSRLETWDPVFDRIAAMAPVIAYDRRGLGKSAPDDQRQSLARVVHSLRSLLAELNVPPPYVLVGHSWGGVIIRAFAWEYGSEVAGLVYVDATDVDLTYAEADQLGPTARQVAFPVPQIPSSAPAGLRAEIENIVQNFRTEFAEARAARPPSSIPSAVVISGQKRLPGATPDVAAGLLRLAIKHQQEWAPSSPVIVARHVGHFVHRDDPGLVLRLTRQVLTAASGGEAPPASNRRLELPLFDASYNFAHGYRAFSMRQTLAITESFYEASEPLIRRAWGTHGKAAFVSLEVMDLLAMPGGWAWLHEEYRRAVLGHRGIDSFNGNYKLNKIASSTFAVSPPRTLAVSHVADEDLVRLKREHPADLVRLSAAGIEGQSQLVQAFEKNRFFYQSPPRRVVSWVSKLSSIAYVRSGTGDSVDRNTDEANQKEGANVQVRDVTGHDFTAWVYDLHRPDEAYAARGLHPSGVGIDRYIKPADLTPEELKYLKRQGRLQLVNLLDPFLFNAGGFTVTNPINKRPLRVNASASHLLTSFGSTVDANIFLAQGDVKLFVVLHSYANGQRRLPGIDAELVDYPITFLGKRLLVSPRAAVWLQPDRQRFDSDVAIPGGLAVLKVHGRGPGRFGGYVEVEGKTAGWVAGHVDLDRNFSVRGGVSVALP
jgi:pimeloyl-ACP methyl ester carboxylesterase